MRGHYWTLKLLYAAQGQATGEKRKDMKKKVERKEKRNLTKAVLTGRKKATHVVLVKSQIKQKRQ